MIGNEFGNFQVIIFLIFNPHWMVITSIGQKMVKLSSLSKASNQAHRACNNYVPHTNSATGRLLLRCLAPRTRWEIWWSPERIGWLKFKEGSFLRCNISINVSSILTRRNLATHRLRVRSTWRRRRRPSSNGSRSWTRWWRRWRGSHRSSLWEPRSRRRAVAGWPGTSLSIRARWGRRKGCLSEGCLQKNNMFLTNFNSRQIKRLTNREYWRQSNQLWRWRWRRASAKRRKRTRWSRSTCPSFSHSLTESFCQESEGNFMERSFFDFMFSYTQK